MKKTILILLSVLLVAGNLAIIPFSFAHGGKTDSEGGHTDSNTGEYHYHHGYPAHQHDDMDDDGVLDCPYEFINATDHSSDTSVYDNNNFNITYTIYDNKVDYDTDTYTHLDIKEGGESEVNQNTITWLCALFLIFFFVALVLLKKLIKYQSENNRLKSDMAQMKHNYLISLNNREKEYSQRLVFVLKQMAERTGTSGDKLLLNLSGAPEDVFINANGLPEKVGDSLYYTVFASSSLESYRHYDNLHFHLSKCHHARIPINIYQIDEKFYKPCKVCKPLPTIPYWMSVHKKLKEFTKDIEL